MTYIISDGNASEKTNDWDEVIRITESWYEYIAEKPDYYWQGKEAEIPDNPDYEADEGDIDALNMQIQAYEGKLADLQEIHNYYNLTVRIEEVA